MVAKASSSAVFYEIHSSSITVCPHVGGLRSRILDVFRVGRKQDCPRDCHAMYASQKGDDSCNHMICNICETHWCYFCGKERATYFCQNGCPWFLDRYHLTASTNPTVCILKLHRLKTLRLLRGLRASVDSAEFDSLFAQLPSDDRKLCIFGENCSAQVIIDLKHVLAPPPLGNFISGDMHQQVICTKPLTDFP